MPQVISGGRGGYQAVLILVLALSPIVPVRAGTAFYDSSQSPREGGPCGRGVGTATDLDLCLLTSGSWVSPNLLPTKCSQRNGIWVWQHSLLYSILEVSRHKFCCLGRVLVILGD